MRLLRGKLKLLCFSLCLQRLRWKVLCFKNFTEDWEMFEMRVQIIKGCMELTLKRNSLLIPFGFDEYCLSCFVLKTLTTSFHLEIRWDGWTGLTVRVPGMYWNRTCGLCGSFDGDKENDYRLPDGSLVS